MGDRNSGRRQGPHPPGSGAVPSRRNDDMSAEAQLGIFLDACLYRRFPHREAFSKIQRIHNRADQLRGVDVRFTGRDGAVYDVDEKAQLYYINRDLPTFAFEIQFLRQGIETPGWFCDRTLLTDLYLLIWPFASQDTPKGIRWDQFTRADCLLIRRDRLWAHLEEAGLTPEILLERASGLRRRGRTGRVDIPDLRGIYYFVSDPRRYREAPVNLVIARERLIRLAQRRYRVTRECVEVL